MFLRVLAVGISLVVIQGIASYCDGYLTPGQLRLGNIKGYSLLEHGGMWADVFIISPMIAYVVTFHRPQYLSRWSLVILAAAIAAWIFAGHEYAKMIIPEAHAHDGHVTVAGWIHLAFAIAASWAIVTFYFTPLDPPAARWEFIAMSLILTPFFYLGVAKFNPTWTFDRGAQLQVAGGTLAVWLVTLVRCVRG